jgi:hypothetical protein
LGPPFKLKFEVEFEFEFEYRLYYTFKFKFKFKVVVNPLPMKKCVACREAFTDVAEMHTSKGCQGKIHSYVVCSSKCPKVDGHDEDNWCSQKCLLISSSTAS